MMSFKSQQELLMKNKKTNNVIYFLLLILLVFPPKNIYIDSLSILLIIVFQFNTVRNKFNKKILIIEFILLLIIYHSLIVFIVNANEEYYFIFRNIRALLNSYIALYLFKRLKKYDVFIKYLLILIFIHSILLIIQVTNKDIFIFFANIYGYKKKYLPLRGIGLTPGMDTAGYYCNIGIYILLKKKTSIKFNRIITFTIFLASFFTSRTSIILTLLIVISQFPYLILAIIPIIYYFIFRFLGNINLDNSYSTQTGNILLNMVILPDYILEILFGLNKNVNSDIGYIKIIFGGGVVYLFLLLILYTLPLLMMQSKSTRQDYLFLALFSFFIMNIKSFSLLSRGLFEIQFLIFLFGLKKER
jgi:hypothetical protein